MKIVIEGELTDFNTFDKKARTHKFHASAIKRDETNRVAWECEKTLRTAKFKDKVHVTFVWYCKNERKDMDNVCFAKKFILDGMVKAGIIEDDSRKYISGFTDEFAIDKKRPRVEVYVV